MIMSIELDWSKTGEDRREEKEETEKH